MKRKIDSCPHCKRGSLRRRMKKQTHVYRNKTLIVSQPGMWCSSCKEGVLTGEDIKATKKTISDFHARTDGVLTSSEMREIRKGLKLTQRDAAKICGGGPNAFSRYECGETVAIRSTSNLLKLLLKHPEEIQELLR